MWIAEGNATANHLAQRRKDAKKGNIRGTTAPPQGVLAQRRRGAEKSRIKDNGGTPPNHPRAVSLAETQRKPSQGHRSPAPRRSHVRTQRKAEARYPTPKAEEDHSILERGSGAFEGGGEMKLWGRPVVCRVVTYGETA